MFQLISRPFLSFFFTNFYLSISSCFTIRNDKDQSAMRMTLNQLLVEMDGFDQNNGVIVIGATNFPDSLDKVLCCHPLCDDYVGASLEFVLSMF